MLANLAATTGKPLEKARARTRFDGKSGSGNLLGDAINTCFSRRAALRAASALAGSPLLTPLWGRAQAAALFSPTVTEQRQALLASYRTTILRLQAQSQLPIIDIEHHWGARHRVAQLIDKMNRCGVALTWLGPNERNGSLSSIEACREFPDRLVPAIVHGDGPRWHGHELSLVQAIDADARSGQYFAMGEFESRHYVSNSNDRDIHMPLDSASFHAVFKAAQDTGLPFLLHHEAEDALLPELEKMLQAYPQANLIWCHVGRNRNPKTWTEFPSAQGVERFILKYPRLHFDIVQSGLKSVFPPTGAMDSILYYGSNSAMLRPEWVKLFNTYPERFLIGSDINTFRWNNYEQVFDRLRNAVLQALTPQAAEMIAFKNAWRLMSTEAWQG
jgi:hypothetical protein